MPFWFGVLDLCPSVDSNHSSLGRDVSRCSAPGHGERLDYPILVARLNHLAPMMPASEAAEWLREVILTWRKSFPGIWADSTTTVIEIPSASFPIHIEPIGAAFFVVFVMNTVVQ